MSMLLSTSTRSMVAMTVLIAYSLAPAEASSFLSRAHEGSGGDPETLSIELESSILQEIEEMLGSDSRRTTEGRLARIEDALRVTFQAMPKSEQGKLQHAAVRYTLHSYFVQRHAWYVRGLADVGEGFNASSPQGILQDRVEEFVQGVFEARLGTHGLNLRETAVLAATFENLVYQETVQRLNATFRLLLMSGEEEMDITTVDEVLDTYMMGYITGLNYSALQPRHLNTIRNSITKIYPTWGETQRFMRELRAKSSFHKSFFSRSDLEGLIEEVGDQFGHWQDKECQSLKQQLLALEDTSIGTNGSGRVRITDFYGSALADGNWQFSERIDYLTALGALDAHDPDIPRVVIPNYINSPSNCLASSKFYSICCINECEDLMDRIEHRFAAPDAAPEDIAEFVSSIPSSTVAAGRTLHPILLARLQEIAEHHDGHVPLHGRLFAQWMHHAYPRECPYPHLAGTTRPQKPMDFVKEAQQNATVSKVEMLKVVEDARVSSQASEMSGGDECTAWSVHEELYVGSSPARTAGQPKSLAALSRPFFYLALAAAAASALVRRMCSGKKAAFAACGLGSGKDLFV